MTGDGRGREARPPYNHGPVQARVCRAACYCKVILILLEMITAFSARMFDSENVKALLLLAQKILCCKLLFCFLTF